MIVRITRLRTILILTLIASLICDFWLPNSDKTLLGVGIFTIALSIFMLYAYRSSGLLIWIIGILSMINIVWAFTVCLFPYQNAYYWQVGLVAMEENVIMAKCVMTFFVGLIFCLDHRNEFLGNEDIVQYNKSSKLIFICGFIVLLLLFWFGFDRSLLTGDAYVSQSNSAYEYAIVIFLFTWIYVTGKGKFFKRARYLLWGYAALYCLQGIAAGDRSSAFPMILLILIVVLRREITMKYLLLYGFLGIIAANAIDLLRNNMTDDFIRTLLSRGLAVNTISYSHYAGTQIIRASDSHIHIGHLIEFIFRIFIGGGSRVSLSSVAEEAGFFNRGGGFTASYFYYWLGFPGVLLGGMLFGYMLNRIFSIHEDIIIELPICVICYAIRWYVYSPISFFRSAILIPLFLYWLCNFYQNTVFKRMLHDYFYDR